MSELRDPQNTTWTWLSSSSMKPDGGLPDVWGAPPVLDVPDPGARQEIAQPGMPISGLHSHDRVIYLS